MQTHRSKQTIVLAGLTLGLIVTGLSPLLDGHELEAKKRSRVPRRAATLPPRRSRTFRIRRPSRSGR